MPVKTKAKTKAVVKKPKVSNASVMEKLQDLIEENEETIHLILEIAAISIEKSNMSPRQKKISKAGLNFISEILSIEEDNTSKTSRRLKF